MIYVLFILNFGVGEHCECECLGVCVCVCVCARTCVCVCMCMGFACVVCASVAMHGQMNVLVNQ